MARPKSRSAQRERFRAALVRSLLTGVEPDDSLLSSTLAFVDERLARIRGVAGLAVGGVERLLSAAFSMASGALGLASPRADTLLRRLDEATLPVVADYVHLVRSLALVFVYEARPPMTGKRG